MTIEEIEELIAKNGGQRRHRLQRYRQRVRGRGMNEKPPPERETPLSGRRAGDAIAGGVREVILYEHGIPVNQRVRMG